MILDEVTLDELLGKLRSGHIGNINDYYRKVFIDFLEELRTLRVESEKNSEELEVLRKAYELSCEELGEFCCTQTMLKHKCDSNCSKHWEESFLQKAREEE